MTEPKHTILLYYKYVSIDNPGELRESQQILCERLGLKGRIIVACEGINGTVEGMTEAVDEYISEMEKDTRFRGVHWKRSLGTGSAFPKLSVKVRPEIVSGHLGDEDINPNQVTGKRVSPAELYEWLAKGEDLEIVDMRNGYEYKIGHFKGSHDLGMQNFRDLTKAVSGLERLKDKKVVTVCTGGVRCEKASGYLLKKGFKEVYQLDGGITSFMEKYPGEFFKGKLYVFDNRITMDFDAPENHEMVGKCDICGNACEEYVNCLNNECHLHFICCELCKDESGRAFCREECRKIGEVVRK